MNRTLQLLGAALVASALSASGLRAQSTNLIDVQIRGTYNGQNSTNTSGAAVLGTNGDVWNQYGTAQNFGSGFPGALSLKFSDGVTSSGASFAASMSGGQITGTLPQSAANGFTAKTGAPNTNVANLFSGTTDYLNVGNTSSSVNVIFTFTGLSAYIGNTFIYDIYYGGAGTASSLTGATGGNTASSLTATATNANINNAFNTNTGAGDAYVQYTGTISGSTLTFNATMPPVNLGGNGWGGCLVGAQLQLVNNSAPISSYLWSNSPTNASWTNGANWAGGTAPATNTQLVFATSSITTVSNTFATNSSFAGISFSSNASAYTVNGNPLAIGYQGLTNASSNSQVINVALSGLGGVTEVGSGTLTLTPGTTNSYTGGNTIGTNGTLVGDSTSIQGTVTDNGKLILAQATNGTASGISGTGSVALSGAGTLTFSGANSYSGGTALNGAKVAVNTTDGIGSGTVTFNSNSTIRNIASAGITLNAPMVVGSGVNATLDSGTNGTIQAELTLKGGISGPGAVTFAATTTNWVTIYENNTYSGGTTLNGGIIQWVASAGSPFGSGNITAASNSYLRGILGSPVVTNAITINSGVSLTLTNAGFASTFSGPISGPGSLAVGSSGAYTTTLSATNSYTGTTTISGGTLALSSGASLSGSTNINLGTLASPGTLDASANSLLLLGTNQTLSGNGTVNMGSGSVTVNGNLTPGSIDGTTVGKITTAGNLTLGSTAVTTLTLVTNGTAGVNYDAVAVTNALSFNGSLQLVVNTPSVGTFNLFSASSYLGDLTGVALTGSWNPGAFMENSGLWTYMDGTYDWTFNISNGNLIVAAIPEPSTWTLLEVALIAGVAMRRKLRKEAKVEKRVS